MPDQVASRREFLTATASVSAAVMAMLNARRAWAAVSEAGSPQEDSGIDWDNELNSYNEIFGHPPLLGRVIHTHLCRRSVGIFTEPGPHSQRIRSVGGDCGARGGVIAPIYGAVIGERYDARWQNNVWYRTNEGYMHSGHLIPCHEFFNEPEAEVGDGFWGEATVPVGWQHRIPSLDGYKYDFDHYKLYWGQVHRVLERAEDAQGNVWYRIYDEIETQRQAWVLARNIRRVLPEELTPISPDVQDKRIVIDLGRQRVTCYEEGVPVFETMIASGTVYTSDTGEIFDFTTPEGAYHVQRKRPSRRMRSGDVHDPVLWYDVNGVPWCTYFSYTGAAIHGAFWHNDFGGPRSHGCINVTADAAKWIYRWSQPTMGYDEDYRWVAEGEVATPIDIILT
jgi:hypothetical protein